MTSALWRALPLILLVTTLSFFTAALAEDPADTQPKSPFMESDTSLPQWVAPKQEPAEPAAEEIVPEESAAKEAPADVEETTPQETAQPSPTPAAPETEPATQAAPEEVQDDPLAELFSPKEEPTEAAEPSLPSPPKVTATPSSAISWESDSWLARWLGYPNLHPLIAHFPMALLLVGVLFLMAGLLFYSEGTQDAGIVLCVLGFLSALAANVILPPQTAELSVQAQATLKWHNRFADLTLLSAGIGGLFGGLRWLIRPLRRSFTVLAVAAFLTATVFVCLTSHFGITLVHTHGVGPQGNHLSTAK